MTTKIIVCTSGRYSNIRTGTCYGRCSGDVLRALTERVADMPDVECLPGGCHARCSIGPIVSIETAARRVVVGPVCVDDVDAIIRFAQQGARLPDTTPARTTYTVADLVEEG